MWPAMVSLWCELISIYTFKNQWITMVSKIWAGMSTTNIHLLQFNFKSLAKTRTLNAGTLELIPKKNCPKFQHTLAILLMQIPWLNYHLEYFGVYFSFLRFKMVHSNTKNPKSTIRQYQVCCLRTTHYSALKLIIGKK